MLLISPRQPLTAVFEVVRDAGLNRLPAPSRLHDARHLLSSRPAIRLAAMESRCQVELLTIIKYQSRLQLLTGHYPRGIFLNGRLTEICSGLRCVVTESVQCDMSCVAHLELLVE